jgi:hypothetical protein
MRHPKISKNGAISTEAAYGLIVSSAAESPRILLLHLPSSQTAFAFAFASLAITFARSF